MNKIDRANLQGIDGWLTLFQIHIIYGVANYGMALIIFPVFLAISNSLTSPYDVFDVYNTAFLPYFIALIAVSFVLLIVCIVLFYKRKMAFRTVFVIESALMATSLVLFYIFGMSGVFASLSELGVIVIIVFRIIMGIAILASMAPNIALIIALFKSQRVKNTFS